MEHKKYTFYGRRKGHRLHTAKQGLMDTLLPQLQIPKNIETPFNPASLFPNQEVWLEIGFGGGEHLKEIAKKNPDKGFIGSEPFINGVASLLDHITQNNLKNIRIYDHDVRYFLETLKAESLGRAFVLFPDPWPKARHHRRRLIQRDTLEMIHRVLKPNAQLRIASDDPGYLEWIRECLNSSQDLFVRDQDHNEQIQPLDWPKTRYQEKAMRENRTSYFFILHRV